MARRKYGRGNNVSGLVYVALGICLGVFVAFCTKRLLLPCGIGLPECCIGKPVRWLPRINSGYRTKSKMMEDAWPASDGKLRRDAAGQTATNDDNGLLPDTLAPESFNKGFILIGVMTAKKYLNTRAIAAYRTWAKSIPGRVVFFSSEGSQGTHGLPLVALPGIDDSYPPQKKSFTMLKYMYRNYIDKYEWFARVDDDIYIRGDKLENFLRSVNSSKPQFIGQAGTGMKEEIGRLSLDVDENYCMGGPGIVFSRQTLARVAEHSNYCLRHFYSTHEDVEVGRCVLHFAGISCTWAFEMQHLFYHNYREEKGSFTHSLELKEVNRAITLHPVKQPKFLFRMHKYFKKKKIMELYQKQLGILRDIVHFEDLVYYISDTDTIPERKQVSKVALEPSLTKFVPEDASDALVWEFFTKSVFSSSNDNPIRGLENSLRDSLDSVVTQVMTSVNKNSRQKGRSIDFKEILYGYRRTNPLYGADYILDLLLTYRKHKGPKLSIPVRRHAYLHQTFLDIELKEDFHLQRQISLPTSAPPSFLETVINKFGLSSRINPLKIQVPRETIHFILPLAGRFQVFERFMYNFNQTCLQTEENVILYVILFKSDDHLDSRQTLALINEYQRVYKKQRLKVIFSTGTFSRGAGLDLGAQQCPENALLFFVDVDIYFNSSVLQRIRVNTMQHKTAYFPIVFSQHDSETVPGCFDGKKEFCGWKNLDEKTSDYGYWRQFGYGITALYKSDYLAVGGFDKNIHGWGKEDVDLFQKFLNSNLTVFRSVDPGLVHIFHPIICDPALETSQYKMCVGSKSSSYGSVARLSQIIQNISDIFNQNFLKSKEES